MSFGRRRFLQGSLILAGLCAAGCPASRAPSETVSGQRRDPSFEFGHRLRDGDVPSKVADQQRCRGVILGGGISGLSAAWRWRHAGLDDFRLLELETRLGGNSRALEYPATPAPIGAHYLPLPNTEARAVRRVLREMDVLQRDKGGGWSVDGRHLCHSPQERLFCRGRWWDGLLPAELMDDAEQAQAEDFVRHCTEWKERRDAQGRKVFALPLHYSSRDPSFLELDGLSFGDYADQHGWTGPLLRWYLNYACRDDFGGNVHECSAWAGLHYFASRDGGGLGDSDQVLVWPEGNRRLVTHLARSLEDRGLSNCLVVAVEQKGDEVWVDYLQRETGQRHRLICETVVCCLPTYVREKLFPARFPGFEYAPWLTANLSLDGTPDDLTGQGFIAWDNVIQESESLGYVVATHQQLSFDVARPTVWTWYRPFVGEEPAQVRKRLLGARWEDWAETVLAELEPLHKDIRKLCRRLDVTVLGHGMVRPSPGLIWGEQMEKARRPMGAVFFGHGDLSGMSLFEESQFRGVKAAEDALAYLGIESETFL